MSPLKYADYSCYGIEAEVGNIEKRTLVVYEHLTSYGRMDGDALQPKELANWPALFALGSNGPIAHEFVVLEGEFMALWENSEHKDCQIDIFSQEPVTVFDPEREISEIVLERNYACPRRSTNRNYCRLEWDRAHPDKAAILKGTRGR